MFFAQLITGFFLVRFLLAVNTESRRSYAEVLDPRNSVSPSPDRERRA
jgi:hypothetical protein